MFMTLSNMLKIGQVYLMDGKWKGQQLVDPAWIKEATAKADRNTESRKRYLGLWLWLPVLEKSV